MGRGLSTLEMLACAELVRLGGKLCCVTAGIQPMGKGVGASLEMGCLVQTPKELPRAP